MGELIYLESSNRFYKLHQYPTLGDTTDVVWLLFGNEDSDIIRVTNDTVRNSLIAHQRILIGQIIYHTDDNRHYKLTAYPTAGSQTGVVWTPFAETEIIRVNDNTERDALITEQSIILGGLIYHVTDDEHYKLDS